MNGTTSRSHDNSPSLAATVCSEHFIIHMITSAAALCVEDIYNSHDNSHLSAATVCSEHFIIHMITSAAALCVEDIFIFFLIHKAREGDGI